MLLLVYDQFLNNLNQMYLLEHGPTQNIKDSRRQIVQILRAAQNKVKVKDQNASNDLLDDLPVSVKVPFLLMESYV